jgi:UDP-N-acetylglucosamine 2-epimerase (non-hydrolysing)
MRLLHVVGTRPNFVKMAPVISACRDEFGAEANVVVHTGQHYDRAMSDVFFDELGVACGSARARTPR